MADDRDVFPGEVLHDLPDGAQPAVHHRFQRLDAAAELPGPAAQRLGLDHALALRVVALDQQLVARAQLKAQPVGDDLRGLPRAVQRGGDDHVPVPAGEHLYRRGGLGAPGVVQRDVAASLQAAFEVPLRLSMADESQLHAHHSSTATGPRPAGVGNPTGLPRHIFTPSACRPTYDLVCSARAARRRDTRTPSPI